MARPKKTEATTIPESDGYSGVMGQMALAEAAKLGIDVEEFEREAVPPLVIDKEESEQDTNWLDISTAPDNGTFINLVENLTDNPIMGYWKRTRKLLRMRYVPTGKWVNALTGMNIGFVPKYWRMR